MNPAARRPHQTVVTGLASNVTLKDGAIIHIRPLRPGEDETLLKISRRLSPEAVYQRFFTALPELSPEMAHHLADVNSTSRMALVAEAGSEPVAVSRYEPTADPETVELGVVILDEWQNRGLGRVLLRRILCAAAARGIRRFRADVLAENYRMLHLLASECTIIERTTSAGITSLVLTAR